MNHTDATVGSRLWGPALSRFLRKHDLKVSTVRDGYEMRECLRNATVDLIVLDFILPGDNGLKLCRDLRADSTIPVIMLTAMGEETDRVVGHEMGADDYLAKPFSPRELLARIKAVLRRSVAAAEHSDRPNLPRRPAGGIAIGCRAVAWPHPADGVASHRGARRRRKTEALRPVATGTDSDRGGVGACALRRDDRLHRGRDAPGRFGAWCRGQRNGADQCQRGCRDRSPASDLDGIAGTTYSSND